MSYATRADLGTLYGLDEVEARESMLEPGAAARALADASAEIDSYLAGRYSTPLAPVPARLVKLCCAIARYSLLGDAATETARRDYEDAIAWLRDVQAGRAQVEGIATVPGGSPAEVAAVVGRDRIFHGGFR